MHNFLRIVRISLVYKWTVFLSILVALCVGFMWGANVTPLYPVIEVLVKGNSMHEWVDSEIKTYQSEVAKSQAQIEQLNKEIRSCQDARQLRLLNNQINIQQYNITALKKGLSWYEWGKPYIEKYLPASPFKLSILICAVIFLGSLIKGVLLIAHNLLVARITQLTTLQLRRRFFEHALKMDQSAFHNGGAADLMSRFTNDVGGVMAGLNILFGKMVREPLKLFFCLLGAALISWQLLLMCFLILPFAAIAISWLAKALKRTNRRAMEGMSEIYRSLDETFSGMEVIQAFTMERYERHRFFINCKNYYQKAMKICMYDSLTQPITELISLIIVSIAIIVGAYLTLSGSTHLFGIRICYTPLQPTALLLFFAMLVASADPARKMADIFTSLQNACAAADRIFEKIDLPLKIVDVSTPISEIKFEHSIEIKHLNFAYTPGNPVLKDINLTINKGETVAFVGLNGCGKSTLIKMLPRFLDPDSGTILVDGVDIKQFRLKCWREKLALVPQNPLLFDDTVSSNIVNGKPGASQSEIVAAAQAACADEFITTVLPEGYDYIVGPRGGKLSGGQRQRIALARAIIRKPELFLLDEATREIDLKSEVEIRKSLMAFSKGRTTILITHDMALLSIADKIVMMEDGIILDIGTHSELLDRCNAYQLLNKIQFSRSNVA